MTKNISVSLNRRLATVKKTAELYPNAITESALRWLIFNGKQNGFTGVNGCVRRLGRKILIDLDHFEHWIDGQKGGVK